LSCWICDLLDLLLLVLEKSESRKFRLNDDEYSWVVVAVVLLVCWCWCSSLDECSDDDEKQQTAGIDASSTRKILTRTLMFYDDND